MNIKTANELAQTVSQGRTDLIAYLRSRPVERVDEAASAVGLPRFAYKLHRYASDITPAMLEKVLRQLA